MKTIILSIPYSMSARNLLRSEAFSRLSKTFKVVILTPLHKDENFLREFSRENVVIKGLPKQHSLFFKVFRRALDIIEGCYFTQKTRLDTLLILEQCLKRSRPLTYWSRKAIGATFRPLLHTMRGLQGRFLCSSYYEDLLNEFAPSLVFLSHPIALEEFSIAFTARKKAVPVIALIHSWDNITAKSGIRTVTSNRPGRMLPMHFDKVIVWNKIVKKEIIDCYDYKSYDVFVTGVPQFDYYYNNDFSDRDTFIKQIGADPSKKLLLYSAGSPFILPKQDEVIEGLVKALQDNRFVVPSQLLIRTLPGADMTAVKEKYSKYKDVYVYQPAIANAAVAYNSGWQSGEESQRSLPESLLASDVTMNVTSTMSLDSVVLDRPTICIGFDGFENSSYYDSVVKHYDYTHYSNVMKTGGVQLAKSPDELISKINDYLKDPKMDSEGRERLRREQCYKVDGKAGVRIASFIVDFTKK
ncbi:hypothetical protein MNBD_DELTA02-620 [hydrothermal vent metagenome]|uniref:Uncharacterized protein n=1 Tax=hydrothermal vent metagenome TaxID=652676 RepID=A0A3B0VDQ9_9ZZZZ